MSNKETTNLESIHGSLIVINGVGTLIIGKSGIGKSEAMLELIQKGHSFVCDDTVVMYKDGKHIYGRPARITKNFLEVRGIGLIDIPFIYGSHAITDFSRIDLVVKLIKMEDNEEFDRLGNKEFKYEIMGDNIRQVDIPITSGRSISSLVMAAASVHMAKTKGMDPLKTIHERSVDK